MRSNVHSITMTLATSAALFAAACGGHDKSANTPNTSSGDVNAPAATTPAMASTPAMDTVNRVHHSKLKGALVGAVAGHMAGGHALAGAAAGAMVQHERNKHGN